MPVYEYICPKCQNQFEVRLSYSETNCTPVCPECYSAAERLLSSFACKTGGNLHAAEKPFRQGAAKEKSANSIRPKKR